MALDELLLGWKTKKSWKPCRKMYFSRKSENQKCKHILDSILVENVSQGILNESAECSDRTPTLSFQSFLPFTLLQRMPKHTNFCGELSLVLKFHAIWAEFSNIEVSKKSTLWKNQGWRWWIFGQKEAKWRKFYVGTYHITCFEQDERFFWPK